jgi:hypothetical protein
MVKLIYQTVKLALWIPILAIYFVLMWAAWAVGRAWHAGGRLMEPDVRWFTLMCLCYTVMPWAFVPAICGGMDDPRAEVPRVGPNLGPR